MEEKERVIVEKTQSEIYEMLTTGVNMIILGPSGWGKSGMVETLAEEKGKNLLTKNLSTEVPETMGGIPVPVINADGTQTYFRKLLPEELQPIIESKGKDWIIFLDEFNQASPEVMNCTYPIAYPGVWAGHPIPYAQIIITGNLDDGTDGTVYLNQIPTPLENRCVVVRLKPSKKDARNYIINKQEYNQMKEVKACVNEMLDNNINPRDVSKVLDWSITLKDHKAYANLLHCKLRSEALTTKLIELQEKTPEISPDELLKNAKDIYAQFIASGYVILEKNRITTEEELTHIFSSYLTDEEIQAVLNSKGE